MIEFKQVTKRYVLGEEIWEMKDLNLEIKEQSFVAITGISGSGKSTLLHLLGGLDTVNNGEIIVDGQDIGVLSDYDLSQYRNQKIGVVFQNFYLYPDINLVENVALPLLIQGVPLVDRQQRARQALKDVGLEGLGKHSINQISGGQRQRVAIARAIVSNPRILLADEPTGNLDSYTGGIVIDLLKKLQQEHQMTVVIVTHEKNLAAQAERVIELKDGQIIHDNTHISLKR